MNCKNCNAVMKIDQERKVFVCPYCDSVEPFDNVSKDELQGMLHKAIHDVRKESLKEAKEAIARENANLKNRSRSQKIKDAVIFGLQILFCLFLAFCCTGFLVDYQFLALISLIQLILMIVILTMKRKWLKTGKLKFQKIKTGCTIAVVVLIIPWIFFLVNADEYGTLEKEPWPTQGLGSTLPDPGGRIRYQDSSSVSFSASVRHISKNSYDAFIKACQEAGYNVDVEAGDEEFVAYHEETDNKVSVRYYKYDRSLRVKVEKAITMTDAWPSGEVAALIPKPELEKCHVQQMNQSCIEVYVGDMTHDEFLQYVTTCQEAGFDGSYYSQNDYFYGNKDGASLTLEFHRGRIMFIRVYISSY